MNKKTRKLGGKIVKVIEIIFLYLSDNCTLHCRVSKFSTTVHCRISKRHETMLIIFCICVKKYDECTRLYQEGFQFSN